MSTLKIEERECEIHGENCTGKATELSYTKTWKQRKESGEPLCECFGDRKGCKFDVVYFHDEDIKKSDALSRDKGNIHDREGDFVPPHCRGCNVTKGNIHHVNCDDEKCSKCGGQILTCKCNGEYGHIFLGKGSRNCEHLNFYRQVVLGK